MTQSRHSELSILQKKLSEWACLGRRRRRMVVIQTELFTRRCKGTAEDHFYASLVLREAKRSHSCFIILMKKTEDTPICLDSSMFVAMGLLHLEKD